MDKRLQVGLGILAVIGLFYGYQMFGTATIAITSEPEGAVVRVDGRQRAVTPVERLELDAGNHRIEVAHSHFASHVEGLTVTRGDHLTRHIEFRLGEGTFELLSNPRGAWVEVDGERLPDKTPTKFTTTSGPHEIAMGREERHIVAETHVLKDGEAKEINLNLNIDPHGSVTITTIPRGAKVEFLNEDIVYAPTVRIQIGEYSVRVSKTGYVPQEFRYRVRYGDNLHHVDLVRDYGMVNVAVEPAAAEVTVSYNDAGTTHRQRYTGRMRVPVGRVEVQARALGYRTGFKSFGMTNQGATARFKLEPMVVNVGEVFSDELGDGSAGPEVVIIGGGSYTRGDDDGPLSEQPAHEITITQPFGITRYEITISDYLKFADDTGRRVHESVNANNPTHAMAYVKHEDAEAYAAWLSKQTAERYRLPSEAEWEYVARAGSTGAYFFGDDPERLCEFGNLADRTARKRFREWDTLTCEDDMVRPGPVGEYDPNPFGVYDIYGNVSEWVADCGMPDYAYAPRDGSAAREGIGCSTHGVRGGSWDSMAIEARSSYRNTASSANDDRGIRLVRVL